MITYDKAEVKEALSLDDIFQLLVDWGGEPEYATFGIISRTICHNIPGEGSRKLYYYVNDATRNLGLFRCYTGCDESFDIFELAIKVFKIQENKDIDLNEAVRYIAFRFGIITSQKEDDSIGNVLDWKFLNNYERIQELQVKSYNIQLKEYDASILDRLNYNVRLAPWLNEGISQAALDAAHIGFFPGGDQITIPHYDQDGRFIGLRGRTLCTEEAERFGKYRPLKINQTLYTHPLGANLYNLNLSKPGIQTFKRAIVFEGEKSCLAYKSFFGLENDISVACCGSSLSSYQVQTLLDLKVEEIIIAFDRQFKDLGDDEFLHLTRNLTKIHNKYKNYTRISFLFDRHKLTGYKDSPVDKGKDVFLQLYKHRVFL